MFLLVLVGCPADRRPEEPPGDRTRVLTSGTDLADVRAHAKPSGARPRAGPPGSVPGATGTRGSC